MNRFKISLYRKIWIWSFSDGFFFYRPLRLEIRVGRDEPSWDGPWLQRGHLECTFRDEIGQLFFYSKRSNFEMLYSYSKIQGGRQDEDELLQAVPRNPARNRWMLNSNQLFWTLFDWMRVFCECDTGKKRENQK